MAYNIDSITINIARGIATIQLPEEHDDSNFVDYDYNHPMVSIGKLCIKLLTKKPEHIIYIYNNIMLFFRNNMMFYLPIFVCGVIFFIIYNVTVIIF